MRSVAHTEVFPFYFSSQAGEGGSIEAWSAWYAIYSILCSSSYVSYNQYQWPVTPSHVTDMDSIFLSNKDVSNTISAIVTPRVWQSNDIPHTTVESMPHSVAHWSYYPSNSIGTPSMESLAREKFDKNNPRKLAKYMFLWLSFLLFWGLLCLNIISRISFQGHLCN